MLIYCSALSPKLCTTSSENTKATISNIQPDFYFQQTNKRNVNNTIKYTSITLSICFIKLNLTIVNLQGSKINEKTKNSTTISSQNSQQTSQ